jgi:hypothetical protein
MGMADEVGSRVFVGTGKLLVQPVIMKKATNKKRVRRFKVSPRLV